MHKVKKEIEFIQKQLDTWFNGNQIGDDDNTIELMRNGAERLLFEIAYFKEERRLREVVRNIEYAAKDSAGKSP